MQIDSRLARIIQSVPGVIFQCLQCPDGSLSFPFVSSCTDPMLEMEPNEIQADAKVLLDRIHPESRVEFHESIVRSANTLHVWQWEGRFILPSGRIKLIRWRAVPERIDGNYILWDGVMMDITARISAEGVLQQAWEEVELYVQEQTSQLKQTIEQLQLTQFLIDCAPDAVFWMDFEASFSYVNRAACKLLGYSQEELLSMSLCEIDPGFPKETWLQNWENLKSVGHSSVQSEYCKKNGEFFPVEVSLIYLQFQTREYGCAFVRDISDRKASEQVMRESEAKFRSMVENANDIIYLLTPEGLFSYVSPNSTEILGYDPDLIQGQTFTFLVHPADVNVYQNAIEQLVETGQKQVGLEYRIQHQDGNWRWLSSNLSPVQASNGRVLSIVGIAHDVTDRVLAETALQKSEAQLRQQAKDLEKALQDLRQAQARLLQSEKMSSLGQMVAGIAHEINNPVSFIHGNLMHAKNYIQDLLTLIKLYQHSFQSLPLEIEDYLEEIDLEFLQEDLPNLLKSMEVGTTRIRDIVRSLRNFSRLDEAERKAVDLHSGIDSTLMILNTRLKATHKRGDIQIMKEYGDLPLVECFPGQLNQVFMNILVNAIDAIEESCLQSKNSLPNYQGKIDIRTELIKRADAQTVDRVVIRIADNGPGMSEEVQQKLFNPFFTTKDVGQGTGMGLSISYQIVTERHGGQLRCHSELGEGAEFIVELPLQPQGT
jgi:two-component system, NtrC family, sensor kinase